MNFLVGMAAARQTAAMPLPVETIDAADDAPPAPRAAPQIPYEPTTSVSRRQFRFLMALTLINTLMLGAFVAGPGIARLTGGWWQDYKRWQGARLAAGLAARQKAQAQAKFAADFQAAAQFLAPDKHVVYEEDPQRAAALKAADADYNSLRTAGYVYFTPKPRQPPVIEISSKIPPPFQTMQYATAFLHARKSPSGIQRVIVVRFRAAESIRQDTVLYSDQNQYTVRTQRQFVATAYHSSADRAIDSRPTELHIQQPDGEGGSIITWTKKQTWENGDIQVKPNDVFRLFAGHPDPIDPSHFTIAYELDSASGVIDGWLRDDETVRLQPRVGRIVWEDGSGQSRRWDPYAAPATATRPAAK